MRYKNRYLGKVDQNNLAEMISVFEKVDDRNKIVFRLLKNPETRMPLGNASTLRRCCEQGIVTIEAEEKTGKLYAFCNQKNILNAIDQGMKLYFPERSDYVYKNRHLIKFSSDLFLKNWNKIRKGNKFGNLPPEFDKILDIYLFPEKGGIQNECDRSFLKNNSFFLEEGFAFSYSYAIFREDKASYVEEFVEEYKDELQKLYIKTKKQEEKDKVDIKIAYEISKIRDKEVAKARNKILQRSKNKNLLIIHIKNKYPNIMKTEKNDIIPKEMHGRKSLWEFSRKIRHLRKIGYSVNAISLKLEISTDLIECAIHISKEPSPVIKYINNTTDIKNIAKMIKIMRQTKKFNITKNSL